MRGNVYKKTIIILYLAIFLFSLFFPFNQTLAEDPTETNPLIISSTKNILLPSESTPITAKLYSVGGETVSFSAFYTNGPGLTEFPDFQTLSQQTCIPINNLHSNIASCSVTFNSAKEKTYIIKASITRDGKTFSSSNITILIAKPITNNQQSSVDTDTTYTPLAPLPGLPETPFQTDAGCKFDDKGNVIPGSCTNPCPFGNYLNIMIKLVIGIAAVLAMVMIVMGGIEYMTSDLISSKEAGKETIKNALLGLFIALGAYLILNTINPKLLSACLDNLPQATIEIDEAPPTASDFSLNETLPTGKSGSCTGEITKISTSGGTITLCSTIANQVKEAIDKAWTKGIKLSGWGWRSKKRTEELRVINGCPDIYKSPPSKCRIPTAIPGTSMHESGLAIDFTCDGVSVQTHDNECYIWLKDNTAIHKLINLKSEAWHWSTNGH